MRQLADVSGSRSGGRSRSRSRSRSRRRSRRRRKSKRRSRKEKLEGRPAQLAELSRSEVDQELFSHGAYVKFFVTFATKVLYLTFCDKF